MASAFDALRQQLADVSNERDDLRVFSNQLHEELAVLHARLNASEARNAEALQLLKASVDQWNDCVGGPSLSEINGLIRAYLAQSAPATDEQGAGS